MAVASGSVVNFDEVEHISSSRSNPFAITVPTVRFWPVAAGLRATLSTYASDFAPPSQLPPSMPAANGAVCEEHMRYPCATNQPERCELNDGF